MKKIVILTGAGIDKESGIETFRDTDGLWHNHKVEDVASIQGWRKDKETVLNFYNARRSQLDEVEPNDAHKILVELEKTYDVTIITQNVSDLQERAGSTNVIHLHGELRKMCSSRNKELTLPYDRDINLGDRHEDGSQLRPYIVWFSEDVPLISKAQEICETADIFIIIGTSLQVYPAAGLLKYAWRAQSKFLIDPNPPERTSDFNEWVFIDKPATQGVNELYELLK